MVCPKFFGDLFFKIIGNRALIYDVTCVMEVSPAMAAITGNLPDLGSVLMLKSSITPLLRV